MGRKDVSRVSHLASLGGWLENLVRSGALLTSAGTGATAEESRLVAVS